MREFIGVKSPFEIPFDVINQSATQFSILKREALMFSRIAMPYLNRNLSEWRKFKNTLSILAGNIEYLYERGIVFEPEIEQDEDLMDDKEYQAISSVESLLTNFANRIANNYISEEGVEISGTDSESSANELDEAMLASAPMLVAGQLAARRTGIILNKLNRLDTQLVSSMPLLSFIDGEENKSNMVQIAINALPVPDESTSWEQIIEYRSDPDSQNKFLDLRHWISEVSRGELVPAEVEERLEYFISQYQRHMKLHRMKANQGVLQAIVVSSAEFAENLIKFKWGKIAQNLFSIKQRKIALMEGELTSPGKEIAYIVKARERFSAS